MQKGGSRKIKTIVRRLRAYKPEKVILFGSYAWGRPSRSSDVDLLIIKNSRKPKHHRITDVERLLYPSPLPTDVLVFTKKELASRLSLGDFFFTRIIREGKTLYEKK